MNRYARRPSTSHPSPSKYLIIMFPSNTSSTVVVSARPTRRRVSPRVGVYRQRPPRLTLSQKNDRHEQKCAGKHRYGVSSRPSPPRPPLAPDPVTAYMARPLRSATTRRTRPCCTTSSAFLKCFAPYSHASVSNASSGTSNFLCASLARIARVARASKAAFAMDAHRWRFLNESSSSRHSRGSSLRSSSRDGARADSRVMNAGTVDGTSSTRTPSRAPVDVMTRARRCDASARPMAAVVRRGEESSSEEEEEEEENDLLDPSSPSKSVSRASASVASSKAKDASMTNARATTRETRETRETRARSIAKTSRRTVTSSARARDERAGRWTSEGTFPTPSSSPRVSALRAAPIARARARPKRGERRGHFIANVGVDDERERAREGGGVGGEGDERRRCDG